MSKKEIKTYGDLAEEYLKYSNLTCKAITGVRIGYLRKGNKGIKYLIDTYGENNVRYAKNILVELSYCARRLSEESNSVNEDYFPYERIFTIKARMEKLNKLTSELDKKIE